MPGEERKTHHGYYFPFMFTLHFKGMASPTCHTPVNSLNPDTDEAHRPPL